MTAKITNRYFFKRLVLLTITTGLLFACSDDSADRDGDGTVSRAERAQEMASDGLISMKPGRWDIQFSFDDIDVPTLSAKQKRQVMNQVAKGASSTSCLSVEEAKNPSADFFGGDGTDNCTYRKFDLSGRKSSMELTCTMEGMGSTDIALAGAIDPDQFDFTTQVAMRLPMVGNVKLNGKAIGHYAGQCRGDEG